MTAPPVNRPPSIQYRVGPDCSKACRQHESFYSQAQEADNLARWSSGASARDQHTYLIGLGYTASVSSLSRHKRHLVPVDVARETADAAAEAALPTLGSLQILDKLLAIGGKQIGPTSKVGISDLIKIVALREQLSGGRSLDAFYQTVNDAFEASFDKDEALTEAVEAVEAVIDETTEEN